MASFATTVMETGWSLRAWRASRAKRRVTPPPGITSPQIFQDGFGTRWVGVDAESGDPVEILAFGSEFVETPEFAAAVGERVARLARVRHTLYARARRLDRPSEDALLLYSDRVAGWRLSDALRVAEREKLTLDISAILALMRQLIPAIALFSRHQRDAAIGSIATERLILTPQGRLVVAEYVMSPGLEKMQLSRERLWRDLRVALPHTASPSRIPPSADAVGMGLVALSLVIGRPLKEDEYLVALGDLVETATETSGESTRPLSAAFSNWISRALQFDDRPGFQSPQEAQVAFEEMLAKERGYVTTPAQLDLFVARLERIAGPPMEAAPPPPIPVTPPAQVAVTSSVVAPAPEPMVTVPPVELPVEAAALPARVSTLVTRPGTVAVPAPADAPAVSEQGGGLRRWGTPELLGVAAIALIEAAVIGWLVTRSAGAGLVNQGEVVIQSRPVAARVVIDGEERGITPLTTALAPGAHILEVRVGRSEPRVIPIEIRDGVQSSIYVELQSVATVGGLDVRTEPTNARVSVDGRFRGMSPLILRDLAPGDHEVLLEAGRQKIRQMVRVEPGMTSQLVVPLGVR